MILEECMNDLSYVFKFSCYLEKHKKLEICDLSG